MKATLFNDDGNNIYSSRLFIFLTDKCNLHCYSCSNYCDRPKDSYWFIDPNDLKNDLMHIKNKIPIFSTFMLTGGEPFLHPNLLEICEIIREIFNENGITIITNGLLLKNIDNNSLEKLQKLNVNIGVSVYPDIKLLNNFKQQKIRLNQMNIKLNNLGTRIVFSNKIFDNNGTQDKLLRFKNCNMSKEQNFLLFKNRIFKCFMSASYEMYCGKQFNSDFLYVKDIKNIDQLLTFSQEPVEMCKYCSTDRSCGDETFIWHRQKGLPYADSETSLMDIFLKDYNLYNILCNDCTVLNYILDDKDFLDGLRKIFFSSNEKEVYNKRLRSGKLDIFIPYYNFNSLNKNNINYCFYLKNLLSQQNFINQCNLYFTNIDNDLKIQENYYRVFAPNSSQLINSFQLKGQGLYLGLKEFFKYSYLKNFYILDINDIDELKDKDFLKKIYEEKRYILK